jgi:hypothetical protein
MVLRQGVKLMQLPFERGSTSDSKAQHPVFSLPQGLIVQGRVYRITVQHDKAIEAM